MAHGTWWMWLLDGERYAHACVEVEPGHDGDPIVALVLQPLATWTAHVRHADGRPAAGARMRLPGSEWKDGVAIPPAEQLQPLQFLGDFDRRLVQTAMVDRHGRLQMRFTPPLVGYTFGRLLVGTARSDETRLDPERLPANVTLR